MKTFYRMLIALVILSVSAIVLVNYGLWGGVILGYFLSGFITYHLLVEDLWISNSKRWDLAKVALIAGSILLGYFGLITIVAENTVRQEGDI